MEHTEFDPSNVIYIFGDVETTGLSEEKERMTEIALVKTDANFNILDKFQMLINPERPISNFITNLTGLTEAMVENEPKYENAIPMIEAWWNDNGDYILEGETEPGKIVFVAHNAPFDNKFINKAFQVITGENIIVDFIDTVSLAREIYPFWKNHKLDTCAEKFGVVNENHHRAMNDTMVLYHIGKRLITEYIQDGLNPLNFVTKKSLHYKK